VPKVPADEQAWRLYEEQVGVLLKSKFEIAGAPEPIITVCGGPAKRQLVHGQDTGTERQIDVVLRIPFPGWQGPAFGIADCKAWAKNVGPDEVAKLDQVRLDVGAVFGLLVVAKGATDAVKNVIERRYGSIQIVQVAEGSGTEIETVAAPSVEALEAATAEVRDRKSEDPVLITCEEHGVLALSGRLVNENGFAGLRPLCGQPVYLVGHDRSRPGATH
jgi:hypothetical protein